MNIENQIQKTNKSKVKPSTESLRIKRETKKKILQELGALNKKDFGKKVTPDQFISLAVSLLKPEHFDQLKSQSLTSKDKFEIQYQNHCRDHGKITKDEFLDLLLKK